MNIVMKTTSKTIGKVCGDIKCIGNFRHNYISYLHCECVKCGHQFSIPQTSWNHVKLCPICKIKSKPKTKKFDTKLYHKYKVITDASIRLGVGISEEWDTREKFIEWLNKRFGDKNIRIRPITKVSHIGPDTVHFISK